MNKVIAFAFLAIFVCYGFHRCSQLHPAEYFAKPSEPDPAATAPQAPAAEPLEVSDPFLDPAHAEIRQRLRARSEAERNAPAVTETENEGRDEAENERQALPESPAAGEAAPMETAPVRSVAALNETGRPDQTGNPTRPESASGFACRGKVHCSQMVTCEEAEFYLRNCPGTKMDGDNDGKPCEDMCGH
jgi:hypothetical protein